MYSAHIQIWVIFQVRVWVMIWAVPLPNSHHQDYIWKALQILKKKGLICPDSILGGETSQIMIRSFPATFAGEFGAILLSKPMRTSQRSFSPNGMKSCFSMITTFMFCLMCSEDRICDGIVCNIPF